LVGQPPERSEEGQQSHSPKWCFQSDEPWLGAAIEVKRKNKMNAERREWEIALVNDEKNTTKMRLDSGSSTLASAYRSSRVCLSFREMSFNALERPGDLNETALPR
jgi:hypothetical protein